MTSLHTAKKFDRLPVMSVEVGLKPSHKAVRQMCDVALNR